MRFSRARYVTLCQQSLVTAAVLAVGVSAAGVRTLDIVPQPGELAGDSGTAAHAWPQAPAQPARTSPAPAPAPTTKAPVDTAPVTPKVREVEVEGVHSQADRPASSNPRHDARQTPEAARGSVGKTLVAESAPQAVTGYATVGVTWEHGVDYDEDQIAVQVRTQKNGVWSAWAPAEYHDEHGPDGAEARQAADRPGTDALVVGDVDKVQMRTETADGTTPPDLKLAVIDPGNGPMTKAAPAIDTARLGSADQTTAGSEPAASDGGDTVALSAMKVAAKPYIYSRAQWGANERLREQSAPAYGTIKTGFVHHTVNANNYSADQVPALLRGIYAYHTQSRGWRDIGYNFLVDRFGRIWEGRWGGVDRAVVGAHTSGYNEVSFAMSAIGNFDVVQPPQVVLDAYARLFAWKLSLYDIPADASRLWVKNRYLQAINGHRDVGQTACPGRYLYAKLGAIRTATRALQNQAQATTTAPPPPPAPVTPPPAAMTSPTETPRAAVTQPTSMVPSGSADLADTGHPDLLVRDAAGTVHVQTTGGQTNWGTGVATNGRWYRASLLAAVGDVTGDGRGDVMARKGHFTRVYAGLGNGHIRKRGIKRTKIFRYANQLVAAGDWNGDRRSDVLMRTTNGYLWMVPGRGAGGFGPAVLLSRLWAPYRSTAVAGDLDGNGRTDLAAVHTDGRLYVWLRTASGTLGRAKLVGQVGAVSIAGGAGDLTGDRIGDLILQNKDGSYLILPGTGAGGFGAALGPLGRYAGLTRISSAQMTGSAQSDLVGTNARRTQVIVVPNNGLTNLRAQIRTNISVPGASQLLNVGDWNRDGKGDVITRESSGDRLVLRRGLGNGQFSAGVAMPAGWRTVTNLSAVGDVTGDRFPDLVGKATSGRMTIFPGDGKTGFLAPVLAPPSLRTFNQIGNGSWLTTRLPGSGFLSSSGGAVPYTATTGGDPADYDWVVGPGDVDGDRLPDLVVRDRAGTLWLLPGTGAAPGPRRLLGTGFAGFNLAG